MDAAVVAPAGLKASKGIQRIWEIAEQRNSPTRPKRYRLYVIEVRDSADFGFYVGSTSRKVETRFRQHSTGDKAHKAARLFFKHGATAAKLRFDLFEGLPYFTNREAAELAEGVLADVIEAQLKTPVNCDVLRSRKRTREQARKQSPKARKAPSLRHTE